jgi:hypothetical protein
VRSTRSALVLPLLLLAACGDDDRDVRVDGRVLAADGTPLAGALIGLVGYFDPPGQRYEAITDADGRYRLSATLDPAYGSGLFGDFGVFVSDASDQPLASVRFGGRAGAIQVPDVTVWDARLAVTARPEGGLRLGWSAAPNAPSSYWISVQDPTLGSAPTLWLQRTPGVALDLPAELEEDNPARVTVLAGEPGLSGPSCGQPFCIVLDSPSVDAPTGTLVASSRGAACSGANADGVDAPLVDPMTGACPLTDGDFRLSSPGFCATPNHCTPPERVTIDLGAPRPVHSIVVHALALIGTALEPAATIETSLDGLVFAEVGAIDRNPADPFLFGVVSLDAPVTTRFVRLSAPGLELFALAEISVF